MTSERQLIVGETWEWRMVCSLCAIVLSHHRAVVSNAGAKREIPIQTHITTAQQLVADCLTLGTKD